MREPIKASVVVLEALSRLETKIKTFFCCLDLVFVSPSNCLGLVSFSASKCLDLVSDLGAKCLGSLSPPVETRHGADKNSSLFSFLFFSIKRSAVWVN